MTYPPFPHEKYKIIMCDPPWRFKTWSAKGKGRGPEQHYHTMSIEDIKSLPVSELADDNCALFLWTTGPMLSQALQVLDTWGFKYKTTAFTWIKTNASGGIVLGLGFYTRSCTELCLLATKGSLARISADVSQGVFSRRREHSRKPDEVRRRIVQLMGDLPRIELFARERIDGWDVWGDEVDLFTEKTDIFR